MSTSLSSLVDNLSKIYKKVCKGCKEKKNQNAILLGLKIINYFTNVKNVKKRWLEPINGLIKKFSNIYQFCNGYIIKFVSLLLKGVYPFE